MNPRHRLVAACAAGVVLGVFYTLSPVTAWFGLAMVVVFACAGRGMDRRERTWIFGLLAMAVGLRLIAILLLFLIVTYRLAPSLPALFFDEQYFAMRARLLQDVARSVSLTPYEYFETTFGPTGLFYPPAYLQLQLGEAPYAIRLLNSAMYLATCVMLYRVVRPVFGRGAALGGLAVVLFMPSMFLWSISTLKEPLFFFITAVAIGAAVVALGARTTSARCIWGLVAAAAGLTAGTVRTAGDVIVGGGILVGLVLVPLARRPVLLLASIALCVAVGAYAVRDARVEHRARTLLAAVIASHVAQYREPGSNYALMDPSFYIWKPDGRLPPPTPESLTAAQTARFAARAAISFVLVPVPGASRSTAAIYYIPEQVVWYVLVVLALAGSVAGLSKNPTLAAILLGVIVMGAAAVSMTSGNAGVLVRHRGMVLVLLPWLSAFGARALLVRLVPQPRDVTCLS